MHDFSDKKLKSDFAVKIMPLIQSGKLPKCFAVHFHDGDILGHTPTHFPDCPLGYPFTNYNLGTMFA